MGVFRPEICNARELKFQRWALWRDRADIKGSVSPGVYLLAQIKNGVPKIVDPLYPEIVYVGETSGQTLRSRWNQFNRSAFEGKFGHSGGRNYREIIDSNSRLLYVAALPVDFEEPFSSTYIRYLERLVLVDFVFRHGRRPVCNLK